MEIICPKCKTRYKVSDAAVGKSVRCKAAGCSQVFTATNMPRQDTPAAPLVQPVAQPSAGQNSAVTKPALPVQPILSKPTQVQAGKSGWSPWLRKPAVIVTVALFGVLFLGVIFARRTNHGNGNVDIVSSERTSAKENSAHASENARTNTVLELDNYVFANEYDANEVAADNKHKGKTVQVVGIVESISKNALGGGVNVRFGETSGHTYVLCSFADSKNEGVLGLKARAGARIRGKCMGKTLRAIILKDCVVVEEDPAEIRRRQEEDARRRHEEKIADERRQRNEQIADAERRRIAAERQAGEMTRLAVEKEADEKRMAEERKKEREAVEEQAKQLAKDLFSGIPCKPVFVFSPKLGIGNPQIDYVAKTGDLASALHKAVYDSKWKDIVIALNAGDGDAVTPDAVRRVFFKFTPSLETRYPVLVRTSGKLSRAMRIIWRNDGLYRDASWDKHPSGQGWIFQWDPLTREGLVIPNTFDYDGIFSRWSSWISSEVRNAKKICELENKPFSEEATTKTLVKEAYEKLKAECLGKK